MKLGDDMSASDLPRDVRQRIESRWSAQMKRHEQQRELEARTGPPDDGADRHDCRPVDIAEWGERRAGDR
jgi:hypothetical protein